jgi:hypothetical protein
MPLSFYSPKKDGSGAALFVRFASKDAKIILDTIQQVGFENGKGVFAGGKRDRIVLSVDEAGAIIHAIENKDNFDFFHSFGDKKVRGSFKYYSIQSENGLKQGFGLIITRDELKTKVGFQMGQAYALREYLKFALDHIFSAIYSVDKKEAEEQKAKAAQEPPKSAAPAKAEKPTSEEEDLFSDFEVGG